MPCSMQVHPGRESTWSLHGVYMEAPRESVEPPRSPWSLHGVHTEYTRSIHGVGMEYTRSIHGVYTEWARTPRSRHGVGTDSVESTRTCGGVSTTLLNTLRRNVKKTHSQEEKATECSSTLPLHSSTLHE